MLYLYKNICLIGSSSSRISSRFSGGCNIGRGRCSSIIINNMHSEMRHLILLFKNVIILPCVYVCM